ncbi:MAG: GWxTD domain-containing protein [Gemmatimonadota bacterium]|nr:GWxTD domain-containing protein [Gemmatimonadota bacterium]
MLKVSTVMLAAALGLAPAPVPAGQIEPALELRAVRFYRADQNRTRVKGLVQIPFSLIRHGGGSAGKLDYTVSVRVADSSGFTLYQQSWRNQAAAQGSAADAFTVEIVDFAVAPGRYRLEVGVQDSVSGRQVSSTLDVLALSDSSRASDLLISPEIRLASANDTVPRPGEFRSGDNLVTAVARVVLTPLRANVFYLLEAYADSQQTGKLTMTVRDSAGGTIVRTPAVPVAVAAGGGLLKGQLDLAGLPPGNYAMVASLELGGATTERSAQLTMAGLGATLARDSITRDAERVTDEGYFIGMSNDQLDRAKEPLGYIAEGRELSPWKKDLSVAAKRRFLTQFWRKRDPTAGTPQNERRMQFYEAIDYANQAYREGGRKARAGWRSDRGRVYARSGVPDDVFRRQQEGYAPPYEVWKYTKGKARYYIFADRTGFGAYQLIYSNDLQEPGIPSWGQVIGNRALADAGQFIGIDLFSLVRKDDPQQQRF